jgi:hypothetical protein
MNGIECAFQARVARDPTLKLSAGGMATVTFPVTVVGGVLVKITASGSMADELARGLAKDTRVYIEGRGKPELWRKDGKVSAGLAVHAWRCDRIGEIGIHGPAEVRPAVEADEPVAAPPATVGETETSTAPAGDVGEAPPAPTVDANVAAHRHWQRPAGQEVPF